ncbi:PD-(D/E)XK nuclease family protein [Desulfatibacillum aliphaticivorans]|uniref:PD-(D/E)XK nuclease family protein n=1 Tax=Desulfatibacillum aliphaticivorans TaxID=218208 RepID=UPI000406AD34|nr:PD-(D/E)XK nuclease family protein [Desulfatibacillum aliphaticivorans]
MEQNILSILGVAGKEDVISNLLRYCIEASTTFRDAFLQNICDIDPSGITDARVFTRVSTGSSGVPDMVIAIQRQGAKQLVIMENKLKADEGSNQTKDYASTECKNAIKERLGWSNDAVDVKCVFLSLFPDQKPESSAFRSATFKNLLNAGLDSSTLGDSNAKLLIASWISLLSGFYSKGKVSDSDVFLAKMQEPDDLEGNFLYFRSFLEGLRLEGGLEVDETFRGSARGRHYFGAKICKPSWRPGEMKGVNGVFQLDAKRDFNIHFEPQFNLLTGFFNFYLHYEVNPYRPVAWVKKNVSLSQYEEYNRVRDSFKEELRSKGIGGLSVGGRSNQAAKAVFDLKGRTVAESRSLISEIIHTVASQIDEIIKRPGGIFS